MISNHVRAIKESVSGQPNPTTTSEDDGEWTYAQKTRKLKKKVKTPQPPANEQQEVKVAGEPHWTQVRAELRSKLASKGGPIPASSTRTIILSAGDGGAGKKLLELGRPADLGIEVRETRP
ncbi:unnamed protein product, partial [Nesidiocoris tenuis]